MTTDISEPSCGGFPEQATLYTNGNLGGKHWRLNGKLHRTDGPAVEYESGTRQWWLHGKLHRRDGPAVEYAAGDKSWWLNGKHYNSALEFCDALGMIDAEKTFFLMKWM